MTTVRALSQLTTPHGPVHDRADDGDTRTFAALLDEHTSWSTGEARSSATASNVGPRAGGRRGPDRRAPRPDECDPELAVAGASTPPRPPDRSISEPSSD